MPLTPGLSRPWHNRRATRFAAPARPQVIGDCGGTYGNMNHREQLLAMIRRLVSGEWTVEQFRTRYSGTLLDDVPGNGLTSSEEDFFGDVLEKLDFTDPRPSDRQYGWVDEAECVTWVRRELELFEQLGAEYVHEHCRNANRRSKR